MTKRIKMGGEMTAEDTIIWHLNGILNLFKQSSGELNLIRHELQGIREELQQLKYSGGKRE